MGRQGFDHQTANLLTIYIYVYILLSNTYIYIVYIVEKASSCLVLTKVLAALSVTEILYLQVWADKGVSTRLPVKQQAYIAAAVAMCIAETDKACLERTKGLLPGILQGISLRLDNPVEAIRLALATVAVACVTCSCRSTQVQETLLTHVTPCVTGGYCARP